MYLALLTVNYTHLFLQLTSTFSQAHVPGALSGPHHSGGHGPPPVMLLHGPPPQQGSGPQHGPPPPQQAHPQQYFLGPPQGKFLRTSWVMNVLLAFQTSRISDFKSFLFLFYHQCRCRPTLHSRCHSTLLETDSMTETRTEPITTVWQMSAPTWTLVCATTLICTYSKPVLRMERFCFYSYLWQDWMCSFYFFFVFFLIWVWTGTHSV